MSMTTALIRTRAVQLLNEHRTREQIEARQLRKFRRLVRFVAQRSPYYQEVIERHRIDVEGCVPTDFPVLTKSEAMQAFDRIVTDPAIGKDRIVAFLEDSKDPADLYLDRIYVVHTSGSSGEIGYFVFGPEDWGRGLCGGLRATPPRLHKHRAAYYAATEGHASGVAIVLSTQRSPLHWEFDLEICEINSPIAPILERLNAFQPTILAGYASGIGMLAERQLQGALKIAPTQIETGGETVTRSDRDLIERAFGVPLTDIYSCSEHLIMGVNRPEYGGMYLFEDNLIFELMPDHTLVTNLFNFTMPLIRYRMNDVLVPLADDVGMLPFKKVAVMGRSGYSPRFVNEQGEEDFISAHTISDFLVKDVSRQQLLVIDRTSCVLRICLVQGLDATQQAEAARRARARFDEILAEKNMRNLRVDVEVVDDLPVDPKTGKFRLIVPAEG